MLRKAERKAVIIPTISRCVLAAVQRLSHQQGASSMLSALIMVLRTAEAQYERYLIPVWLPQPLTRLARSTHHLPAIDISTSLGGSAASSITRLNFLHVPNHHSTPPLRCLGVSPPQGERWPRRYCRWRGRGLQRWRWVTSSHLSSRRCSSTKHRYRSALAVGAIVGITLGVVAGLLAAWILWWWYVRRCNRKVYGSDMEGWNSSQDDDVPYAVKAAEEDRRKRERDEMMSKANWWGRS
jgi:hypothetical protein